MSENKEKTSVGQAIGMAFAIVFVSALISLVVWVIRMAAAPYPTFEDYIKDQTTAGYDKVMMVNVISNYSKKMIAYSFGTDTQIYQQMTYDGLKFNNNHCSVRWLNGSHGVSFTILDANDSPLKKPGSSDTEKLNYIEKTLCSETEYRQTLTSDPVSSEIPSQLKFVSSLKEGSGGE
jgi:hypothetical protein